jgi:hypothetical protein
LLKNDEMPGEEFFELIMKCQSSRLEDQRSNVQPQTTQLQSATVSNMAQNAFNYAKQQAITVPPQDDDFFSLIQKLQSRRLDEQRSEIPKNFTVRK